MAKHADPEKQIMEDLILAPGLGATMSVGSDCYPYYISEVLPNRVIGLYTPGSHFEKDWTDGHEVVDKYDPARPSEMFIKRAYGHWWKVSRDGKTRIGRFTGRHSRFSIGHACSYRDPSF